MEHFIQFNKLRFSIFLLPDVILLGANLGFSVDEDGKFHKSLAIGFIFIAFSIIFFDEETH